MLDSLIEFDKETYKSSSPSLDFKKINIFVGANNSGKSRFLRSLLKIDWKCSTMTKEYNNLLKLMKDLKETLEESEYYRAGKHVISSHALLCLPKFNTENSKIDETVNDYIQTIKSLSGRSQDLIQVGMTNYSAKEVYNQIKMLHTPFISKMKKISFPHQKHKYIYIPSLRGLRPFSKDATDDFYKNRTMKDYFNDFNKTFDIFTGHSMYQDTKKMLLGSLENRELIRNFEKLLAEKVFFVNEVTLIPNIDNDVLHIKIGNQNEHPIYSLGDGIQSILIITFTMFMNKDEDLVLLIEEPDLFLHPGMQRILLSIMLDDETFPKTQCFFTTHSNHFLDLVTEASENSAVYSFQKDIKDIFLVNDKTSNRDLLTLLGVRSSSVFLSNCIIWVEGISDRLYLQSFLKLYTQQSEISMKFAEDIHYSIVEYGGGNLTHFNFSNESLEELISVSSINHNHYLIADNDGMLDNSTEEKGKRLQRLNEILQDRFYCKHYEIENTIPVSTYKKFFKDLPESGKRNWCYNERLMTEGYSEIENTKQIGVILKEQFIQLKDGKTSAPFANGKDISIIGPKAEIARNLVKVMKQEDLKFDDLPSLAQDMTTQVYKFIEQCNKEKR